jgi:hypothetical protein
MMRYRLSRWTDRVQVALTLPFGLQPRADERDQALAGVLRRLSLSEK